MATTTYSIKYDDSNFKAGLESTKKLQDETYNSFIKGAVAVRQAEEKRNKTIHKQINSVENLQNKIKELSSTGKINGKVVKNQAEAEKKLANRLKQIQSEYIRVNRLEKKRIANLRETTASSKKYARELKSIATAQKGEATSVGASTVAQKKSLAVRNTASNQVVRHIRQLESLAVAYYAVTRGMDQLVIQGVRLNKTIEDGKVGIGALITANTTLTLSNGKMSNDAERFQASMVLSARTIKDLKREAKETSATFPELVEVFNQAIGKAMGAGDAMGKTTRDVIKNTITLSKQMTNIAGATGMEMHKVKQEIRAIMMGDITKDAEIAMMLGITSKQIDEAKKEAGGLFKFLQEKLEVFKVLETEETFSRLNARWKDALDTLRIETSKPIFDDFKTSMKDMTAYIAENTAEITEDFHEMYQTIKDGAKVIVENKDTIILLAEAYAIWRVALIATPAVIKSVNTVSAISLALSKAHTFSLTAEIAKHRAKIASLTAEELATRRLNIAMKATPIGLAITGIALLTSGFFEAKSELSGFIGTLDSFKSKIEELTIAKTKSAIADITEELRIAQAQLDKASSTTVSTRRGRRKVNKLVNSDEVKDASNEVKILTERLDALNKALGQKRSGGAVAIDPFGDMKVSEIREARDALVQGLGDYAKVAGKLGIKGSEASAVIKELRADITELNSYLLDQKKITPEADDKELKAIEKKRKAQEKLYADFIMIGATAEQQLAVQYNRDLKKFEGVTGAKEKLYKKYLEDLEKLNSVDISQILAQNLSTALMTGIQDGLNGDFDFQNFASGLASSIGNAIASSAVSGAITKSIKDANLGFGASAGIGIGMMVLGKLFEKKEKTPEKSFAEKMAEELKASSEALQKTVSILELSGQEGTAIKETVLGKLGKISGLEARKEQLEEALLSPSARYPRIRQKYQDEIDSINSGISTITEDLKKDAITFTRSIIPTLAKFGDLADELSGTSFFSDAKIARAKKSISGIVNQAGGFDALVTKLAEIGVGLEVEISTIQKSKVGSDAYNSAVQVLVDTLGDADAKLLISSINMSDSINLVGDSFTEVAQQIERDIEEATSQINQDIATATSNLVSSFSTIVDAMQGIIDTAEQVDQDLFGSNYYDVLDDVIKAQSAFEVDPYDADLASDFQRQVERLSGTVESFTDESNFATQADYEFSKTLVAQQFAQLKATAEATERQVAEDILLLQSLDETITEVSQIEADILESIRGQATEEEIKLMFTDLTEDAVQAIKDSAEVTKKALDGFKSPYITGGERITDASVEGSTLPAPYMTTTVAYPTYSSGGYTGEGGKYEPAGIVHKGEYVINQDDLKNVGGVQAVERMLSGERSVSVSGSGNGDMLTELRASRRYLEDMSNRIAMIEDIAFNQLKENQKQLKQSRLTNSYLGATA